MSVDIAIDVAKKLEDLKKICKPKDAKASGIEGYVRRAEDFPALMLQAGLVSALTFFLSKADLDKVNQYFNYWKTGYLPAPLSSSSGETSPQSESGRKSFHPCDDLGEGAGKGYSAYTASLFYVLTMANDCKISSIVVSDVLKCLDALESRELKVERKITPILLRIKELSVMLSPESEGEAS
ncbi:type III-B CRISPR module-associated protein Cmr5 [Acidilobus sp.]|uniref:type III-B CRISPR module-associated protein Cmr5 n=1 Tax=Acidilobus sp. TaxID=1872109 RepID=UPI003D08465B